MSNGFQNYAERFQKILQEKNKEIMALEIGDEYILNGQKVLLKRRSFTTDSLGLHIYCEWEDVESDN